MLNMNHHNTTLTRKDITMDYPNNTTNTYEQNHLNLDDRISH